MEPWMLAVAGLIIVLPFVLMVALNPTKRADSRGRRVDRAWRVRKQQI